MFSAFRASTPAVAAAASVAVAAAAAAPQLQQAPSNRRSNRAGCVLSRVQFPVSQQAFALCDGAKESPQSVSADSASYRTAEPANQKQKEIEKKIDFVKLSAKSEILSSLDTDTLTAMLDKCGNRRWYKKGTVLIEKGEVNSDLFIVGNGKLGVWVGETRVATLNPGNVVGEAAVVHVCEASATVKVASDSALVMAISHSDFKDNVPESEWEKVVALASARRLENVSHDFLKNVPIFEGASEQFLEAAVKCLKFCTFKEGETIFIQGTTDTHGMFYIIKGELGVFDSKGPVATLGANNYVGENMLLAGSNAKRLCSVSAKTHVEMYQLTKSDFLKLSTKFPKEFETMKSNAKSRSADVIKNKTGVRLS